MLSTCWKSLVRESKGLKLRPISEFSCWAPALAGWPAALTVFGFADPLIIAGLGGSGALGLKKMMWDAWRRRAAPDEKAAGLLPAPNHLGELKLEAILLRKRDITADADALDQAIVEGGKLGLSPEAIREVYVRTTTSGRGPPD